jgi:DNA processing protein
MKAISILTLQLLSNAAQLSVVRKLVYTLPSIEVDTAQEIFELYRERVNKTISFQTVEAAYLKSKMLIEQSAELNIQTLTPSDVYFPQKVKTIKDAPLLLFVKGSLEALQGTLVAVVGTREPSEYGSKVAYKIAQTLAKKNIAVVSGLALGIDTQAHQGCLSGHGKTIAVLAHGLDMVYPAGNQRLAQNIIAAGGCLISEYPIQTKPQKFTFVHRNRLQSGFSMGSIVIESQKDGGTMHQSRFCAEQKRLLGCIRFPKQYTQPTGNAILLEQMSTIAIQNDSDLSLFLCKVNPEISDVFEAPLEKQHDIENIPLVINETAKRPTHALLQKHPSKQLSISTYFPKNIVTRESPQKGGDVNQTSLLSKRKEASSTNFADQKEERDADESSVKKFKSKQC